MHFDFDSISGQETKGNPIWIGLVRNPTDEWEWTDGTPLDYENWNEDFLHGDDRAIMWADQWANDDCTVERGYICRLRDPSGSCPADWVVFEGDCYHVGTEAKSFEMALVACIESGGNLLGIDDGTHYNRVMALVVNDDVRSTSQYWIGYLRNTGTGDWSWADGSPTDFERWFPGFPDGDPDRNCAYAFPSTWDDYTPGFELPYACKKAMVVRE